VDYCDTSVFGDPNPVPAVVEVAATGALVSVPPTRPRPRRRGLACVAPGQPMGWAIYGEPRQGGPMPFIQIIEYKTSRIDELNAALDGWLEKTKGKRAATRGLQTRDRDATDTYVQIVEFPSYDEAMANSNLPETSEFAAQLASLCDGPPTFRNLDVLREEQM